MQRPVGLGDVERRQLEQLQRVARGRHSAARGGAQTQFDATIRSSREDAARRLRRELELTVERFAREAEGVSASGRGRADRGADEQMEVGGKTSARRSRRATVDPSPCAWRDRGEAEGTQARIALDALDLTIGSR